MFSKLSTLILNALGWKIEGEYPHHQKKMVLTVAPHTSAWDVPLGFLIRSSIKADIKYIGKKSLFAPPFGFILKWLGGYPVDRDKNTNFVEATIKIFHAKEEFTLVLTPEGTRKKVDRFKTGFYYIAKGANVPILMVKFDFGNKVVGFSNLFYPGDDAEADIEFIWNHYRGVVGKVPRYSIT